MQKLTISFKNSNDLRKQLKDLLDAMTPQATITTTTSITSDGNITPKWYYNTPFEVMPFDTNIKQTCAVEEFIKNNPNVSSINLWCGCPKCSPSYTTTSGSTW